MKVLALWHDDPRSSSIRHLELEPSEPLVWVRSLYSLVSTGTETLVARGQVPEELHQSMQVPYMGGTLGLPVKYGYSLVGRVESGPEAMVGRRVHLLHPHQDHCLVEAEDCTLLPDDLPPPRATLASNLETAVNAVWDAGLGAGDRVLVVGFGLVGALCALLAARYPGVQVWVSEKRPDRLTLARSMGLSPYAAGTRGFDKAIHASASREGLQRCIEAVGAEGTVVEVSWYGKRRVELSLGGSFHRMRKRLISSQVSSIPPRHRPRWDFRRRKALVLQLLRDPAWDALLDRPVPFAESPRLFDRLRSGKATKFSYLLHYF